LSHDSQNLRALVQASLEVAMCLQQVCGHRSPQHSAFSLPAPTTPPTLLRQSLLSVSIQDLCVHPVSVTPYLRLVSPASLHRSLLSIEDQSQHCLPSASKIYVFTHCESRPVSPYLRLISPASLHQSLLAMYMAAETCHLLAQARVRPQSHFLILPTETPCQWLCVVVIDLSIGKSKCNTVNESKYVTAHLP
jgi:hypothetical protein